MKTSSCKQKGRRACQEAKDMILRYIPVLSHDDIVITSSGDTGEDLKLSPRARNMFPFSVECKNQEKINIWKGIEQAKTHAEKKGFIPLLLFTKNRHDLMACIPFEILLQILTIDVTATDDGAPLSELN